MPNAEKDSTEVRSSSRAMEGVCYEEPFVTTENDTAEKIFHNSCDFSAASQAVEMQSTSRVVRTVLPQ